MRIIKTFAIGVVGGVIAALAASAGDTAVTDKVFKEVDPTVVCVQHERGCGSGFIISPDGYILTNGHVVQGDDKENPKETMKYITVILSDERKYPAEVIGFCMNPDVALIKIDPDKPLKPVKFGDSDTVKVGQPCFAVGAPLGLKRSFTKGIISNTERTDLNTRTRVLQTDAAINHGNSGGPLFDAQGRVLGINTYGMRGNNLGFTIPINVALVLKDNFLEHGRFIRSSIPLFFTSEIYDDLAGSLGVTNGLLVTYVMQKTPAEKMGLKAGDILTAVNGTPVKARTKAELLDAEWVWSIIPPGTKVELTVLRGEPGKYHEIKLHGTMQQVEPEAAMGRYRGEIPEYRYATLGLGIKPIVRLHRVIYSLGDDNGVMVMYVLHNSVADRAGLLVRDVITAVGGTPVKDDQAFRAALEEQLKKHVRKIEITYQRNRTEYHTVLKPLYKMLDKKVLVITGQHKNEYYDSIRRELVASGADLTVKDVKELDGIKADNFDVIMLIGNSVAESSWTGDAVKNLVSDAWENDKICAAVGAAALALPSAVDEIKDKKITASKEVSGELVKLGAKYTGSDVEKDGRVLTTTGTSRKAVREFVNKLKNM